MSSIIIIVLLTTVITNNYLYGYNGRFKNYSNITEYCKDESKTENPEYNSLQNKVYVGTCTYLWNSLVDKSIEKFGNAYLFGQPNNETRSLNTCYSQFASLMLFASAFSPNFNTTILNDPELKSMITNYCNFYHEKTGMWLRMGDAPDPEIKKQFQLKYNDSITHLKNKLNQTKELKK